MKIQIIIFMWTTPVLHYINYEDSFNTISQASCDFIHRYMND